MKTIFLLSPPRSGSTLLQRVLAGHPEIATRTEPWILLPMLYMIREEGVLADYSHKHSILAITEFLDSIDQGGKQFESCVRQFIQSLYTHSCDNGESFFLDKTPRYSLIAPQLCEVFPDEKFIILWRNPLSIIASIIKTFRGNKFMFLGSSVDLYEGFQCLYEAYEQHREKVFSLNYEEFVTDSHKQLRDLFEYLEIEYDPEILENLGDVVLPGTYGDKTGYSKYDSINQDSISGWKNILNNPVRKLWCRRYLKWIGRERLQEIGYSYEDLIKELDDVPNKYSTVIMDVFYLSLDLVCKIIEPFVMKRKLKKMMSSEERMYFLS